MLRWWVAGAEGNVNYFENLLLMYSFFSVAIVILNTLHWSMRNIMEWVQA